MTAGVGHVRRLALAIGLTAATAVGAPAAGLAGVASPIAGARVTPSVFSPDGDGVRDASTLVVTLAEAARVSVSVEDFDGGTVRTLLSDVALPAGERRVSWRGRDDARRPVPNGPYRFVVTAPSHPAAPPVAVPVVKARSVVYPARPGAIVVAIDPGHGGSRSGAEVDGYREADFNLDVGLRLRAMLQGSGVRVVMTRTTDTDVNVPEWDRNADGEVGYTDELQSRPDVANPARADLFLSLHNNIAHDSRVGGPSTFYSPARTFAAESYRLATHVQSRIVASLRRFRTSTWTPYDHGVLRHPYFVLSPYDAATRPRPTLMPGVLGESLFLSHPYELTLLRQPRVRTAIAEAYFEAVAGFLADRPRAVAYQLRAAPEAVELGAPATYRVRVTNRGTGTATGWRLDLRAVPAVPLYDGSDAAGALLGSVAVPILAPGQGTVLEIIVTAPAVDGDWLVKADIGLSNGRSLAALGSPPLQVPLRTGAGTPEPTPSPSEPAATEPAATEPVPTESAPAAP